MFEHPDCYELLTNYCQMKEYQDLFTQHTLYKSGISSDIKDADEMFFTMKQMIKIFDDSKRKTVPTADQIKQCLKNAKIGLLVEQRAHEYLNHHGVEEQNIPQYFTNTLNKMLNVNYN